MGRFRELGFGDDAPSLEQLRFKRAPENTSRVVAYLRAGKVLVMSPGLIRDAFDTQAPAGSRSTLTDGAFAWPDGLAHYVERYAIALPQEFEDHMARLNWTPPDNVNVEGLSVS